MKNVFYLIGVLVIILIIVFFLANVKPVEGFSTTPDNVKIATDAINNSSVEQKARIANVLAPQTTTRAPTAAQTTTRAPTAAAAQTTTRAPTAGSAQTTTRAPTAAAAQTTRAPTAAAQTTRAPTAGSAQTTRAPTAGSAQTTTRAPTAVAAQTTRAPTAAAQTTTRAPTTTASQIVITNSDKEKLTNLSKKYLNQSTLVNNIIDNTGNFENNVKQVIRNTQSINNELIDIKEAVIERIK